jgi:hypothetical protein
VSAALTETVVAPGHRISFVVDVTPVLGMHVYGPGNHRLAVCLHQNDLSALGVFRANLATPNTPFEFRAFIGRQCQRHMARQHNTSDSVVTVH